MELYLFFSLELDMIFQSTLTRPIPQDDTVTAFGDRASDNHEILGLPSGKLPEPMRH